jgi:hypothetical protein
VVGCRYQRARRALWLNIHGGKVGAIDQATKGQPFSTTVKMNNAKRSAAEWILEAPWSGGVLPLANFDTAAFGVKYTGVIGTSTATIGNKTGTIGSFGLPTAPNSPVQEITMVTSSGAIKAQPQGLDDGSFQVKWVSSGP